MKLVLKAQPGRKPSFTNHSNRIVTQNYPPPQNCLKDHISGTVSQPWEFHCFAMGMHTLNRKSQDVPLPLPQRASLCLVSYQFLLGFFIFVRVGVRDLTFTCITISSNSRRPHPGRACAEEVVHWGHCDFWRDWTTNENELETFSSCYLLPTCHDPFLLSSAYCLFLLKCELISASVQN